MRDDRLTPALVVQAKGRATIDLVLTHDEQLGGAAVALGFAVVRR